MPVTKPNPQLFRPHVPKAPRLHALFGTKYFKAHQFRDDLWPPSNVTLQYKCMVTSLAKHLEFKKMEKRLNMETQNRTFRNLRVELRDGRERLKKSIQGDVQRIRNLLEEHHDLQRLYQSMPTHLIVDNINQRTFVKRKERDRLTDKLKRLMHAYEEKLIEQASLEDQIKYGNEILLKDDVVSKEYRKQIAISATRMKALRTIQRCYKQMIQTLMQDALYYEPVLDSLQGDIVEQNKFIEHITMIGHPVLKKLNSLIADCRRVEDKARREMKTNIKNIADFKKRLVQQNDDIVRTVRKTAELIGVIRSYDRETISMTDLRTNMEAKESIIKTIQTATLCTNAKDVYPRMKHIIMKNATLGKGMKKDEQTLAFLLSSECRTEAMTDSLLNDLTPEEIERLQIIDGLKTEIKNQKKLQDNCEHRIAEFGEINVTLRYSIWNIVDVLRNIGNKLKVPNRKYPNDMLKLPLLKFTAKDARAWPPDPFEENIDTLISDSIKKVKELMGSYKEASAQSKADAQDEYHRLYMAAITPDLPPIAEGADDKDEGFDLGDAMGDPSVMNRKQIKQISAKIVEQFAKKEED